MYYIIYYYTTGLLVNTFSNTSWKIKTTIHKKNVVMVRTQCTKSSTTVYPTDSF